MIGLFYYVFFLAGGLVIAHYWLPRLRPLTRWYAGASLGFLLMVWLPALWACAVSFTVTAHLLAALTLCLLSMVAYLTRDDRPRVRFGPEDRRMLRTVLLVAVPLTLLAGWLEYTHSIRLAADGTYHVGQSTYGDLQLHLAVATSAVNAKFPLQNSLMVGATMAYPYLGDTFATTMYMLGMSLPAAMAVTGTLMCASVFVGFALLTAQLARRRGTVALAVCLLFLNGGLGFFYTLSGTVENGVVTTAWDNLRNVLTGYYQTPTNQPDPNNLRWSNILCDMLVPQRGLLSGWTMLMPVLLLILPPLARRTRYDARALVMAGIMAGGMPLLYTHSFLSLALASLGFCLYATLTAPLGRKWDAFQPFLLYGGIAAALSLPQLVSFTFVQATGSDHFLRLQFNWCNNRGGNGLVDPYFWFYIKNIGPAYLLILLGLLQRRKGNLRTEAEQAAALTDGLYVRCHDTGESVPAKRPAQLAFGAEAPVQDPSAAATAAFGEVGSGAQAPASTEASADVTADTLSGAPAQAVPDTLADTDAETPADTADPANPASLGTRAAITLENSATLTSLPTDAANPAEGEEENEPDSAERVSLYAHEMPAYGQSRLHEAPELYARPSAAAPYVRPLPPEKLRAAAFSPDDSDRVGVMRAVTGMAGEEPSHRPLLEEIFHATYQPDSDAEQAARAGRFTPGEPETCFADDPPARDWVRQNRLVAAGAFLILLLAEFVLFQPNEYDNNKLIYVWFLLCLPMAADYALEIFARLKGLGGRKVIGALFLTVCFLSSGLTVAREAISDYQVYSADEIAVAAFVKAETPEHCVFLTGNEHLNPVASLAGRTIVCGSDLYLYFHGFSTTPRKLEVQSFYEDPAAHLDLLAKYGVSYLYLSPSERYLYDVDDDALRSLFPVAFESDSGSYLVLSVPESYRSDSAAEPAAATLPSPTPDAALNPDAPG